MLRLAVVSPSYTRRVWIVDGDDLADILRPIQVWIGHAQAHRELLTRPTASIPRSGLVDVSAKRASHIVAAQAVVLWQSRIRNDRIPSTTDIA